ncbi:hypothetical protein AB7M18_002345 [Pseudomonas viridiflava]
MNFATWSIRNPIPSILLFILLSLAGVMGFRALPIANMPDVDLPTVVITLTQPGAAPAQLETEVARKVENSLATLSGIKHITTSIVERAGDHQCRVHSGKATFRCADRDQGCGRPRQVRPAHRSGAAFHQRGPGRR